MIEIPLISLKKERITESFLSSLKLEEKYLMREVHAISKGMKDDDDPSLGWTEPTEFNEKRIFFRKNICEIKMSWQPDDKAWRITIGSKGATYSINLFFKREKEAKDVFDQVLQWSIETVA